MNACNCLFHSFDFFPFVDSYSSLRVFILFIVAHAFCVLAHKHTRTHTGEPILFQCGYLDFLFYSIHTFIFVVLIAVVAVAVAVTVAAAAVAVTSVAAADFFHIILL